MLLLSAVAVCSVAAPGCHAPAIAASPAAASPERTIRISASVLGAFCIGGRLLSRAPAFRCVRACLQRRLSRWHEITTLFPYSSLIPSAGAADTVADDSSQRPRDGRHHRVPHPREALSGTRSSEGAWLVYPRPARKRCSAWHYSHHGEGMDQSLPRIGVPLVH